MIGRGDIQKIGERHPPPRQDWDDGLQWHGEPDGTVLVLVIPMLGFALTIMLVISFLAVLHGAAPGIPLQRHGGVPPAPKADRAAVFVL